MNLAADDRARLRSAAAELPLTELRCVSHSFSFLFNAEGARAVGAELKRLGFARVWVGEEITGDDYWHVTAWRRQSLTQRVVANSRRQMETLAVRNKGTYDGWEIADPRPCAEVV
jgi:hypothetical protein